MNILDQTGDLNGQNLYRLLNLVDAPLYVKEASSNDLYGVNIGLTSANYANPINNTFPTHTKAATWVSTLSYLDNLDKVPPKIAKEIFTRLTKSAEQHGILDDILKLASDYEHIITPDQVGDDHQYALVVRNKDGSKDRYYRISNIEEVKTAAAYLKTHQDVLPYSIRQTVAERLLDKASELGTYFNDVDTEYLQKQAGLGVCAASDAVNLLRQRASILPDSETDLKNELNTTAQICESDPVNTRYRETLIKLASTIDTVDRLMGLNKTGYGHNKRPEDVLFSITKHAAEKLVNGSCTTTTGNVYSVSDLKRVNLDSMRDLFGDDFAEQVSSGGLLLSPEKLAECVGTLPLPDAVVLDKYLASVNVKPLTKEASSAIKSDWFDREQLALLAE